MVEVRAHAEIRVWSQTVGAVVELDNGRILFEYDDAFASRGIELSPLHLPTERRGPIAFDELRRSEAFGGLPGVLADALPDAFGNRVLRAWFQARGLSEQALSPVQRLLYVGERALGALTFHPSTDLPRRSAEDLPLELSALVRDARNIIEGRAEVTIPEIYRIGSSAGGMRPKALVLHDPIRHTIRSGHAEATAGERRCILKFDGAGTGRAADHLGDPLPYNRVEAAYAKMARAAGLDVVDVDILEHEGYAHLLIPRFDREGEERVHQHTFGGLAHIDFNLPGASSYDEYLRAVLALGMAGGAVEEAFRRAVFNVTAVNQDDHVKNLSFLLPRRGSWKLSPAYDLTFARGMGFTARHQMRIADKTVGITRDDLIDLGRTFGVRRTERLIEEVETAVSNWGEFAEPCGVWPDVRGQIADALHARAVVLRSSGAGTEVETH